MIYWIHYCPLLFLRDASRNRWHHTELAVSCMITWLPPKHRNSKRHRMSVAIQPLQKICCTFTAAYVPGPLDVKNTKILMYKVLIRPALTYASETWTLSKTNERRLSLYERKALRCIFGAKQENEIWRKRYNYELY